MEKTISAVEQSVQVESREVAVDTEQLIKQLSDAQLAYVGGGVASILFA